MGNLTATRVKAIKDAGRYSDGQGLMLVVKPSGARSWQLRIQSDGKRRDIGLGSATRTSLSEAREKAVEAKKQIRAGIIDPVESKRALRVSRSKIPTFKEASLTLHGERKTGWRNEKHRAQWLSTLETYVFPSLGSKSVDTITAPDIRDVLLPIWQGKPETARRVLQRVGKVLDWALSNGHRPTEAPLRSVRAGLARQTKASSHFAALPHGEVSALMGALSRQNTVGRMALRFLILTAARSGEVRGATWPEINLEDGTWTIPAERMKAKKEHIVPLSPGAVEILEAVKPLRTDSKAIIFPGHKGKALSDMTLTKVLRTEIGGKWTVHGFRSSFRDWAAECSNQPSEVAETALAHAIPDRVVAAYRRTNYLEKRRILMAD